MCPTHSEAKQTETSESGAEKGLLGGRARRTGGSCLKTLNSPMVSGESLIGKLWGEGSRACDFLLSGWWGGGGGAVGSQLVVAILHLGGGLRSGRRAARGARTLPQGCSFLTAPPLFPHPLPSLISNGLNLPFGTQERS